jgi:hypothetical protein
MRGLALAMALLIGGTARATEVSHAYDGLTVLQVQNSIGPPTCTMVSVEPNGPDTVTELWKDGGEVDFQANKSGKLVVVSVYKPSAAMVESARTCSQFIAPIFKDLGAK